MCKTQVKIRYSINEKLHKSFQYDKNKYYLQNIK